MKTIVCQDTGEVVNTYSDYLKTKHWKKISLSKRTHGRCVFCYDRDNLNVHHLSYRNLGNERKKDLVVLCKDCHTCVHKIIGKKWNRLKELTKKVFNISNQIINKEYDDKTPSMKTGTVKGRLFSLKITKNKIPDTLRLSICAIVDRGLRTGIIEDEITMFYTKRKAKDKPMFDLYLKYKKESDEFIIKQYNKLKNERTIP